MKALKRISAMAISFAMVMSCLFTGAVFAAPEFTDLTADNAYYKAIVDLAEKGIVDGMLNEDGSTYRFEADSTITRAEFAKLIAVADAPAGFSFTSTTSSFTDCAVDYWATPYIEYAAGRKIVNGRGDGTFAPELPVTYAEAMKMVVCALNYGSVIEPTEPWYDAYISLGNQLGLNKNAVASNESPAPRGLVAQLIYNMNSATPAVRTGTDSYGNPTYGTGSGSKEESSKKTKTEEGQLIAVFKNTITGEDEGLNKKEALLLIDDDEEQIFVLGDYTVDEITEYLGYEVKITYTEDSSGDYEITRITKTSSNKDYVISDIDISNITESAIEYYDDSAKNGIKTLKFDTDMKVLRNGGAIDSANLISELSIDSGEILFIDCNGNGRADVAFIKSYETMYVGNVTSSNGTYTVYDKFDSTKKFVFDDDTMTITVKLAANGSNDITTGSLSSIAATNIISVAYAADDANKVEIIVSKRTASGSSSASTVSSINGDYETVTLSKKEYDVSNYYLTNIDSTTYPQRLEVGDSCTVYLDFTGKIAAVDKKQASSSYGYITMVGTEKSSSIDDNNYLVRMYDISGKLYKTLPVATKGFKLNGSSADGADLKAAMEAAAAIVNADKADSKTINADCSALVKYEISNGTLKSVYVIDEDDEKGISPKYICGETPLTFSSSSNTFKLGSDAQFTISASTKVFVVPDNRNDSDYRVTTGTSYFTNGSRYIIDAYDVDGSSPAKAVVVYGINKEIKSSAATILVESINSTMNDDGESVQELKYYTIGSLKKDDDGNIKPETILTKKSDTLDGIEAGDVIKILQVGTTVERAQHLFSVDDMELITADIIGLDGGDASYYESNGVLRQVTSSTTYLATFGTVSTIEKDSEDSKQANIEIEVEKPDGTTSIYRCTTDASTAIYKYTGDTSSRSGLFDFDQAIEEINSKDPDPDIASKVFVYSFDSGALKGIIIYE